MPTFDMSIGGGLETYGRKVLSRIGVGVMASLIGCSLLTWGVFPIAIQNQTFADILIACTSIPKAPTIGLKILIVLGTAAVLGFSERAITSLEQNFFGGQSGSAKN
jgi:hypothetical protein